MADQSPQSEPIYFNFNTVYAYAVLNPSFAGRYEPTRYETEQTFMPLNLKERVVWWIGRKLIEFGEGG